MVLVLDRLAGRPLSGSLLWLAVLPALVLVLVLVLLARISFVGFQASLSRWTFGLGRDSRIGGFANLACGEGRGMGCCRPVSGRSL